MTVNFAARLVAGPPVLATVSRTRAHEGDVILSARGNLYEVEDVSTGLYGHVEIYEVRSLEYGRFDAFRPKDVTAILTKAEARAARAHYADIEANR